MALDLRQLRYFVVVAEEKHFGRAAARLAMTQPPLSQQIRSLEEALGVSLFARTKRSVELTPVACDLLPEVRRLLAGADGLKPLAQSLARGETGVLSLAFVSIADYGLLPPLLRAFTQRYARVRLQLLEATSDVQIEELVAGRIDAGLVIPPLPARHAAGLSYLPIAREPLVIAMSTQAAKRLDAAPGRQALGIAALAQMPLVIFPRHLAPAFYDTIVGCYAAAGLEPRIGQEAIQMQTIVSLVSAGMGVALVPRSLCNLRRTGVVYRSLRRAPTVETGLVWRTAQVSPVLSGFIDVARTLELAVDAGKPTARALP